LWWIIFGDESARESILGNLNNTSINRTEVFRSDRAWYTAYRLRAEFGQPTIWIYFEAQDDPETIGEGLHRWMPIRFLAQSWWLGKKA